ncbi:hypothetical protein [Citrobacter amalonaticus]
MTLEQRVEALEFKVEFPEKNGLSFTMNKDLAMKFIQRIGSSVSVKIGKENVAAIQYSEDLTPELTLEGYNQRAKEHAQNVVSMIIEAAKNQAACMQISKGEILIKTNSVNFVRLSGL